MMTFEITKKEIDIYTDGSCSGNPGPGGWSGVVIHDKVSLFTGHEIQTTNNRMELIATINIIKLINQNVLINLFTDSNYVKNGITIWIHNWIKNNWKNSQKKDVANIQALMPRVVDNFQTYLRELRLDDLRGSAGMYRLREELLTRINVAVQPSKVSAVLFKEMLVQ